AWACRPWRCTTPWARPSPPSASASRNGAGDSRAVIAPLAPLVERGTEVECLFPDVSSLFPAAARERVADPPLGR
ncbi:hypothetical protein ACV334_33920, partial [Pseudomonas aeruginosa]